MGEFTSVLHTNTPMTITYCKHKCFQHLINNNYEKLMKAVFFSFYKHLSPVEYFRINSNVNTRTNCPVFLMSLAVGKVKAIG